MNNFRWAITIFFTSMLCGPSAHAFQSSGAATPSKPLRPAAIRKTIKLLKPIHKPLEDPLPGEWLDQHKEKGQTFAQYVKIRPNVLSHRRNKLYVQPIGDFSEKQTELIKLSSDFLSLYYQCESVILDAKPESSIPDSARRVHPEWNVKQWLTTYILEEVLAPGLPEDAFASIAFTEADLWPGKGWNFVFGYAMLRDRVGVWSINRFGNPADSDEAYLKCLQRTVKLATHETGHMFSMQHCTLFQCNMQGSNHLKESDKQPLGLCPQCHAKLLFATGCSPAKRFKDLAKFCHDNGMKKEAKYFELALEKVER